MAERLPAVGSSERIPCLALLVRADFAAPVSCLVSNHDSLHCTAGEVSKHLGVVKFQLLGFLKQGVRCLMLWLRSTAATPREGQGAHHTAGLWRHCPSPAGCDGGAAAWAAMSYRVPAQLALLHSWPCCTAPAALLLLPRTTPRCPRSSASSVPLCACHGHGGLALKCALGTAPVITVS